MSGLGMLGMQAANQGIGAILGLALQKQADRRQLEQQGKLQKLQIQGSKELTDFQTQKQLEMWRATSYPAQLAMMKEAGLNPSLMYGGAGSGGSTNVSTGNVASGNAPAGGGEIQAMMGMALQRDMQKAQIENLKAQTEKTKAETSNVPLTGENIKASTGSLLQGIESSKTQQALTEVQTAIASIDEHIKGKTQNAAIDTVMKNLSILTNDESISNETRKDKIKLVAAELYNKVADTLNKEKQAAKSEKEISEIESKIKLLDQQFNINSIDEEMAKDGFNPKAGNVLKWVHNFFRGIAQLLGN